MDIRSMAKRRKTVRKFKRKKPSINDILYCIQVAREAPSGMNAQPWKFLIVREEGKKKEIRKICERGERKFHESVGGKLAEWLKEKHISWKKEFLENAPFLVIILSFKKVPYFIQSTWLAIGYFLLALEEKGLATVTYTPPDTKELCDYLKIPDEYRLETILPVGYSNDEKEKEERKTMEEIVYVDAWGKPHSEE
ncbi:MAG: nitroreductase family protein [Thermoplasmata archaeon]|nr:MAG: nitroreductase family protein [Thermoplasmata archaeon]